MLSTLYAYIYEIKLVKSALLKLKKFEDVYLQAGVPNVTRASGRLRATLPAASFYVASLCGVQRTALPAAPLQSTIISGLCHWGERVSAHQGEGSAVKGVGDRSSGMDSLSEA